jgi:hypothetical protein
MAQIETGTLNIIELDFIQTSVMNLIMFHTPYYPTDSDAYIGKSVLTKTEAVLATMPPIDNSECGPPIPIPTGVLVLTPNELDWLQKYVQTVDLLHEPWVNGWMASQSYGSYLEYGEGVPFVVTDLYHTLSRFVSSETGGIGEI